MWDQGLQALLPLMVGRGSWPPSANRHRHSQVGWVVSHKSELSLWHPSDLGTSAQVGLRALCADRDFQQGTFLIQSLVSSWSPHSLASFPYQRRFSVEC